MYQSPYFSPYASGPSLLRAFPKGFSLSSILNGTSKTLNFINQAIPVVKQIGPTINNAKTMFKVMNEFKKMDTPKKEQRQNPIKEEAPQPNPEVEKIEKPIPTFGPTFFQ